MAKYSKDLEITIYALLWQGFGIYEICKKVSITYTAHLKWMKEGLEHPEGPKGSYYRTVAAILKARGDGMQMSVRTQTIEHFEYNSEGRVLRRTVDVFTFAPAAPDEVEATVVEGVSEGVSEGVDDFAKIRENARAALGLPPKGVSEGLSDAEDETG